MPALARRSTLALTLATSCLACASSQPSSSARTDPPVVVEAEPGSGPGCAELVDAPRTVLDGRLSLRLPTGLEPDALREWPEYFEVGPVGLPCVGGRTLVRLSLSMRPENRDYMLIDFRDDALDVLEYPYGMKIRTLVEDERSRELISIIDVSTDASATRIGNRVYMRVFKVEQFIYILVLEASQADFEALLPSFEAVAASGEGTIQPDR